jgi:hypothetical protein
MFKNSKSKRLDRQAARIQNLEWDIQTKDLEIRHLADAIKKLDKVLVEAGILEYGWEPSAPKGSLIHADGNYSPTYTKVNKVF